MKVDWRAVRWSFWAGVVSLVILLGLLVWGGSRIHQVLMDEQQVPLDAIVVQGDMQYTDRETIRQALTADEVGSFFAADVNTLRQRVEALPWIYQAAVRKEWPGRLRIYVVEQQPMAIWNDAELLNEQGEIFTAEVNQVEQYLPHLRGPKEHVGEVIRQYQRVGELLEMNNFKVDELVVTDRFSVSVELKNGINLRLGREARLQRVQRFVDMFPLLSTQDERPIDYVDLRYDTGVAVGWHEQEEVSKP